MPKDPEARGPPRKLEICGVSVTCRSRRIEELAAIEAPTRSSVESAMSLG